MSVCCINFTVCLITLASCVDDRYSTLKALCIGMMCTMFDFFNIPVFWPILVLYFIILFTITMKKQIRVRINICLIA